MLQEISSSPDETSFLLNHSKNVDSNYSLPTLKETKMPQKSWYKNKSIINHQALFQIAFCHCLNISRLLLPPKKFKGFNSAGIMCTVYDITWWPKRDQSHLPLFVCFTSDSVFQLQCSNRERKSKSIDFPRNIFIIALQFWPIVSLAVQKAKWTSSKNEKFK